jgi:YgiT-type zinc finger domain-containing protein
MMCVICKQDEVRLGKVTVVFERDGTTVVIKGVPARICGNCGEEYVDELVTRELLRTASAAAVAGVQVEVQEYVAA